jgi:hypothetical protein
MDNNNKKTYNYYQIIYDNYIQTQTKSSNKISELFHSL